MTCICSGILFADVACHPISRIPKAGELLKTEKIELNLGGCAANVAFDLVRLGVPVTLAGQVGDDALSGFIVRSVSESGISTGYIERSSGQCPGTAIHINVCNEDRRFICTTGANDDFIFGEKLVRLLTAEGQNAEQKILYLGGFFMLQKLENEQTPQLLRQAQEAGWLVILDVVLYGERPYWEILKPLLPYVDFFLPNEHEGETITGRRSPNDQAQTFLDAGVKSVLITGGENGVFYFGEYRRERQKIRTGIYPAEYVSGSGAGDAFCAGFIAALLDEQNIENALRWGCAAGASCVRGVSTTQSVFNRTELLTFIGENPLHIAYGENE